VQRLRQRRRPFLKCTTSVSNLITSTGEPDADGNGYGDGDSYSRRNSFEATVEATARGHG
jgi:hypothetical protein